MDLLKLSIPQLEGYLLKWIKEVEGKGIDWAKSKALFESLDDKKKPLLASLAGGFKGSQAYKEQMALSHNEYETFLNGLGEARKSWLLSQVNYDTAKLKVDCLRTVISARKEEVKNFKG